MWENTWADVSAKWACIYKKNNLGSTMNVNGQMYLGCDISKWRLGNSAHAMNACIPRMRCPGLVVNWTGWSEYVLEGLPIIDYVSTTPTGQLLKDSQIWVDRYAEAHSTDLLYCMCNWHTGTVATGHRPLGFDHSWVSSSFWVNFF